MTKLPIQPAKPGTAHMTWLYHQATGRLCHDGTPMGTGYSGKGADGATGRNNPDMESVGFAGPIPAGKYGIGRAYNDKKLGPSVMRLAPVGHAARGRNLLLIHGNNNINDASTGCIILSLALRHRIAASRDKTLTVER